MRLSTIPTIAFQREHQYFQDLAQETVCSKLQNVDDNCNYLYPCKNYSQSTVSNFPELQCLQVRLCLFLSCLLFHVWTHLHLTLPPSRHHSTTRLPCILPRSFRPPSLTIPRASITLTPLPKPLLPPPSFTPSHSITVSPFATPPSLPHSIPLSPFFHTLTPTLHLVSRIYPFYSRQLFPE